MKEFSEYLDDARDGLVRLWRFLFTWRNRKNKLTRHRIRRARRRERFPYCYSPANGDIIATQFQRWSDVNDR